MESPTSVRPFLRSTTFEFWSQCFTAVTFSGLLREGLCALAMHGYRQAVMTSFEKELMGSRGFSLIPLDRLSTIISVNPWLLLPSKSVLAYAKKGWHWHAGDYPPGWEKKVKVMNIFVLSKKSPAKLKSTSKSKSATPWPSTNAPPSNRT